MCQTLWQGGVDIKVLHPFLNKLLGWYGKQMPMSGEYYEDKGNGGDNGQGLMGSQESIIDSQYLGSNLHGEFLVLLF